MKCIPAPGKCSGRKAKFWTKTRKKLCLMNGIDMQNQAVRRSMSYEID